MTEHTELGRSDARAVCAIDDEIVRLTADVRKWADDKSWRYALGAAGVIRELALARGELLSPPVPPLARAGEHTPRGQSHPSRPA